ncbi:SDR family oxidoreductase [Novosphingobium sp. MMS21-SN21R]|uniref:SDR family NAD(P)-dependent oxidoreductase n=1 Tax=Novosphingobium sp. MMS21-SN21R TaxID=2969298 RepID=UPI002885D4C4|nr:SDR family oxidoreductase [Novosphingobium sp. MMS21-SN21R]MDT0509839.1 SDR family oxidoreductase [Novosphingobium sp. MMS21-SN21R]
MSLTRGSVILVTGASGAIGFEIAAQAAAAGAVVAMHGSRPETVAVAMERLVQRAPDARLIAAPADFREEQAIAEMVGHVVATAGRLDAVVHCGITGASGVAGPLATADPAQMGRHAALVLGSFAQLCHAALPHLAQQGGTIVGFASDAGKFSSPRQAVIGAAFGGIMTFVRNLALEVARQGVRVHCISPSFVAETPVFEAHAARAGAARDRAGLGLPTPADIAPMVLFLCGTGAAKITGQVISINGGLNA